MIRKCSRHHQPSSLSLSLSPSPSLSSPTCPCSPSTLWLWSRTRSRAWGCSRQTAPCTTRPSSRWGVAAPAASRWSCVPPADVLCVCFSLYCSANRSMKRGARKSRTNGFEPRGNWYEVVLCDDVSETCLETPICFCLQMECETNLRKAKQTYLTRCEEYEKAKTATSRAEEEGGGATAKSLEKKKRAEEDARNKVLSLKISSSQQQAGPCVYITSHLVCVCVCV